MFTDLQMRMATPIAVTKYRNLTFILSVEKFRQNVYTSADKNGYTDISDGNLEI